MVSRLLAHPSLHASADAAPSTRSFPCPILYKSEASLRSALSSGSPYRPSSTPQSSRLEDYDDWLGRLQPIFLQPSQQLAALLYVVLTQVMHLIGRHRQSQLLPPSALQPPGQFPALEGPCASISTLPCRPLGNQAGFTPSSQVSAPATPTTRGVPLHLSCRPACAISSSRPDQPRRRDASLISFGREALQLSARFSAHAGLSCTPVASPQLGDYGQPIAPLKGHDRFLLLIVDALFTPTVLSLPSIGGFGDPANPLRSRADVSVLAYSGPSTPTTAARSCVARVRTLVGALSSSRSSAPWHRDASFDRFQREGFPLLRADQTLYSPCPNLRYASPAHIQQFPLLTEHSPSAAIACPLLSAPRWLLADRPLSTCALPSRPSVPLTTQLWPRDLSSPTELGATQHAPSVLIFDTYATQSTGRSHNSLASPLQQHLLMPLLPVKLYYDMPSTKLPTASMDYISCLTHNLLELTVMLNVRSI